MLTLILKSDVQNRLIRMTCTFKSQGKDASLRYILEGSPQLITTKSLERPYYKGQVARATSCLVMECMHTISSSRKQHSYHIDIQTLLT